MSPFEKILVWFGGYRPSTTAASSPEAREPIAKIGGIVLFAAMGAILNWAAAGWIYSEGSPLEIRAVVAVLSGVVGAAMVAVLDRTFIYFVDTSDNAGRLKLFGYAALRSTMIIAVSSITSQFVMPLLMAGEMRAHALHMVEDAEKARVSSLYDQYAVAAGESAAKVSRDEVSRLEKAESTLPTHITLHLGAARTCWQQYGASKAALMAGGDPEEEVVERLARKAGVCAQDTRAANSERDQYLARVRNQLRQALDTKASKEAAVSKATATITDRVDSARRIEADSYGPRSSTVLWSLVTTDRGALIKWAFITFLQLVWELLPLLQKLASGQSGVGRSIATNRQIAGMADAERLAQREHEFTVSRAVIAAAGRAVDDAMRNPEVKAIFAQAFAGNIAALAPMEAVRAMMSDLAAGQGDMDDFMHRYPRYAAVIAQAWSNAVKQTSEILARGLAGWYGPSPSPRG